MHTGRYQVSRVLEICYISLKLAVFYVRIFIAHSRTLIHQVMCCRGGSRSFQCRGHSSNSPRGNTSPNSQNNWSIVNANHPLTSIQTEAGARQVEAWISGWRVYGSTRWDLGLQQVADSSDHYDFILFITDGLPTNQYGSPITNQNGIIAAANNVKAKGTRIIAVYAASGNGDITTDLQRSNLQAISGPVTGDPSVLLNDYYMTDWSNMVSQFQDLANLCGPKFDEQHLSATRTIHYVDVHGAVMAPDVVQPVAYTRTTNLSTSEVTYSPENPSYPAVTSPVIAGYTPDQSRVGTVAVPVNAVSQDLEVTVVYTPTIQRVVVTVVDDDMAVQTIIVHLVHQMSVTQMITTRTITYSGAGELTPATVVQSVQWTVTTDLVTKEIVYTTDEAGYPIVVSPLIDGYTARPGTVPDLSVPESTTDKPQSTTVAVVYSPVPIIVQTGGHVDRNTSRTVAGVTSVLLLGGLLAISRH